MRKIFFYEYKENIYNFEYLILFLNLKNITNFSFTNLNKKILIYDFLFLILF